MIDILTAALCANLKPRTEASLPFGCADGHRPPAGGAPDRTVPGPAEGRSAILRLLDRLRAARTEGQGS